MVRVSCIVCGRPTDAAEVYLGEQPCGGCQGEYEAAEAEMEAEFAAYDAALEAFLDAEAEYAAAGPVARRWKGLKPPLRPAEPPIARADILALAKQVGLAGHIKREEAASRALQRRNLLRNADGFSAADGTTPLRDFTDVFGRKVTVAEARAAAAERLLALVDEPR